MNDTFVVKDWLNAAETLELQKKDLERLNSYINNTLNQDIQIPPPPPPQIVANYENTPIPEQNL